MQARIPLVLTAIIAIAPFAHAGDSQTALDVYGRLPSVEDMAMSPDGSKFAYVRTSGDQRSILIRQLGEAKPLGAFRVGYTKLRAVRWMDDDNLLITRSNFGRLSGAAFAPKAEWFQLATYRVSTQALGDVDFQVRDARTPNIFWGDPVVRVVEGKTTLFVPGWYFTSQTLPGLFKLGVADGSTQLFARGLKPSSQWLIDETGRVAAQFSYDDQKNEEWTLQARKGDQMAVVASGKAALDLPKILGFSANGDSIIVQFIENGDPIWKPLLLKDGSWGEPLARGAAFSIVIADRKTGRIIGGVPHIEDGNHVFFDSELQAHWNAVLRAFPNEVVNFVSVSDDYTKYLVKVFGVKDGYSYALFDWFTHQAVTLAPVYEGIGAIAEVRRVSYPATDGLTIPGYLTLPPGAGEKNLPLIVMPHGGPEAADAQQFDWWAQALAVQGYAVLQPNFRGSSLSYKFVAAGFGEWGRKMQTDLSDGVRYLAKQGVIDPKRVCIVGASYGGYAALAGVTLNAGVYRCAVSVAGVSDLKVFRTYMGSRESIRQRYWDRYLGITDRHDASVSAISPIEHVSAVDAPVLLIHGRDDTVVPFEQSDLMLSALKRAGKSVEFVTLKHEDHWLSSGETRLQMLEASVAFLKKNNPPN
jgi:dienelactone hydrolase